jgi:hypothetical protein
MLRDFAEMPDCESTVLLSYSRYVGECENITIETLGTTVLLSESMTIGA